MTLGDMRRAVFRNKRLFFAYEWVVIPMGLSAAITVVIYAFAAFAMWDVFVWDAKDWRVAFACVLAFVLITLIRDEERTDD